MQVWWPFSVSCTRVPGGVVVCFVSLVLHSSCILRAIASAPCGVGCSLCLGASCWSVADTLGTLPLRGWPNHCAALCGLPAPLIVSHCPPSRSCAITAQRTGEPAWHRRQRRRRAQDRVLARVAAAREALARHHSAQHNGAAKFLMYRNVPFIPDVPRGINLSKGLRPWSCNCGEADNWLCRPRCKKCGREQPSRIAADAKKMAERCRRERDEGRRSPSRGRSRERDQRGRSKSRGRDGGGNSGNKKSGGKGGGGGGSNNNGGSSKTYAEAARRTEELKRQVAAERREKEALAKKLAAATARNDGDGNAAAEASHDDDDEADAEEARDNRLLQLQSAIEALEPVVDADDAKLGALRGERDALVKARREGKPLKIQLLTLDRKLGQKRTAIKKVEAKQSEAWAAVERTRKEAEALDKEHEDLLQELDTLESDKKDLLRRELDGDDSTKTEDAHWLGTVGAIRTRLQLPGIDPMLAAAVATTLEQLRQQCLQLPALVPAAAGQCAATTPARTDGRPSGAPPTAPVPAGAPAAAASGGGGGAGNDGSCRETTGQGKAEDGGGNVRPPATAGNNSSSNPASHISLAPHGGAAPLRRPAAKPVDAAAAEAAAAVTVPTADGSNSEKTQDVEMGDVEALLGKLSTAHRKQILAKFGGRATDDDDQASEPTRERERSPRPTKNNEAKEL